MFGLEDSPKPWYPWFTGKVKVIILFFIKHSQKGKLTLLLVYVNDIFIAGNDEIERHVLREKLAT